MEFCQVKQMLRGIWGTTTLALFSNFKWARNVCCFVEQVMRICCAKWATSGKQDWRCGMLRKRAKSVR